jgi:hypothetical protein
VDAELDDSKVFADELQARGDPRGELLSLELAAESATSSAEARRLNREAQRIRDAHPALVWPEALRRSYVAMHAGFAVQGSCDDLFAPQVPIELALSLRTLHSSQRRLEDVLPNLIRARARGLALDWLTHTPYRQTTPTNLAGLRTLGAHRGGRWPATCGLQLSGALENVAAITGLTGLESLCIDTPISRAELRSLAGLELKMLRVHAEQLDPALVELFGATLKQLELRGCKTLADAPSLTAIANLARLPALEKLSLPVLDNPKLLDALGALRLRSLYVDSVAAELLPALTGLTNVEHLGYREIIGEPDDFSLPPIQQNQRELVIRANTQTELLVPASIEELLILEVDQPLAIVGAPTSAWMYDSDPRCLPPSLLLGLRDLQITWSEVAHPDFLAELPQRCPNLEHFELTCYVPEWQWSEAPQILAALPQLRRCSLGAGSVDEIAERGRAFPELSMSNTPWWPRSCGETPRMSVAVPREAHPFAALRDWMAELRSVDDWRGELLELELAAELSDDPRQARVHNREANHLRARLVSPGWPEQLAQARALVRGSMPIHSDGDWFTPGSVPDTIQWLRGVEIRNSPASCLWQLRRARDLGMVPQRLTLHGDDRNAWDDDGDYTAKALLDALRSFRRLDGLELLRKIPREYLAQLPPLGLRHLGLCASNYDPELIHRFANTLRSLLLTDKPERATLEQLQLPHLESLRLGRGWSPAWALARRDLRSLGLSIEATDELPAFDWPGLEVLELEFLGWHAVELALPASLERLRLSGVEEVVIHGACERLELELLAIDRLSDLLCEHVRCLTVLGDLPPQRSTLERFGALEWLSISREVPLLHTWLHELDAAPRLRTLVVRGLPLAQVTAIAELRPELAVHGVDPGWRDPERWPLPPAD